MNRERADGERASGFCALPSERGWRMPCWSQHRWRMRGSSQREWGVVGGVGVSEECRVVWAPVESVRVE
eukprot:354449-Chlamydomonas_euryale.AAC.2